MVAACPTPKGTWKASAAICRASVCAASWLAPILPIRKAAAPNTPASAVTISAIGAPLRAICQNTGQSGTHQRPKMW